MSTNDPSKREPISRWRALSLLLGFAAGFALTFAGMVRFYYCHIYTGDAIHGMYLFQFYGKAISWWLGAEGRLAWSAANELPSMLGWHLLLSGLAGVLVMGLVWVIEKCFRLE